MQRLADDNIAVASHLAGVITLPPSLLMLGGRQFYTQALTRTITDDVALSASALYFVYAQIVASVPVLRVSLNAPSVYRVANPTAKLVAAFYTDHTSVFYHFVNQKGPAYVTVRELLSGTAQTYITPGRAKLVVSMVGGGGSGAGGGIATPANGNAGNNTSFGTLIAGGGGAGVWAAGGGGGGGGGGTNTFSGQGFQRVGAAGGVGGYFQAAGLGLNIGAHGGSGGVSFFGGGGQVSGGFTGAQPPSANSGSGGAGGGAGSNGSNAVAGGGGGGSGGFVRSIIPSPDPTYLFTVAAATAGGGASTGGAPGSGGAAGSIIVEEHKPNLQELEAA